MRGIRPRYGRGPKFVTLFPNREAFHTDMRARCSIFGNYRWSPVRFAAPVAQTAPMSGTMNPQHHGAQVDRFPDFVDSAALVGDERVAEEDVAGLLREALEPGRVEPGQVAAISAELFVDLAGEGTHHAGPRGRVAVEGLGELAVAPEGFAGVEHRRRAEPFPALAVDEHAEVVPVPIEVRHEVVDDEHLLHVLAHVEPVGGAGGHVEIVQPEVRGAFRRAEQRPGRHELGDLVGHGFAAGGPLHEAAVLELVGDIVALVEQPRAQDAGDLLVERFLEPAGGSPGLDQHPLPALDRPTFRQVAVQGRIGR